LPNRTDLVNHFNVGITGTMGTGKTQLTKSLLAQIVWGGNDNVGGRPPGILIFDYKGDYADTPHEPFATAIGARVLAPEQVPLNPLHPSHPSTRQQFALLPQVFADTLRAIDSRVGTVQRNQIVRGVKECYQTAGIDERLPETWTRPFPTIRDLYAHVEAKDLVDGIPRSILHDLTDLGVFADEDPAVELDDLFDGINVVNLKPLGGTPTVIRAILCFFMNALYDRMLQLQEAPLEDRGGHRLRQLRRLILVDEADDFIGLGLTSLKNVMQQGRSFGHGVVLSTQYLHHFNKTDTPLRPLVGTWVLHQMADLNPSDIKALFSLRTRDEVSALVRRLGTLPQHTSLCQGLSGEGLRARLVEVRDLPYMRLRRPTDASV
jgi:DNA phosphorothioation-dependent restriction protein DptH